MRRKFSFTTKQSFYLAHPVNKYFIMPNNDTLSSNDNNYNQIPLFNYIFLWNDG